MDDVKVGALARAVRHRLGWTQKRLGGRIGVSQQLISLFERGQLDEMTLRRARRIGGALEIQLPLAPRWRGGDGARLLDADHAALVDLVIGIVREAGWEVIVEYSFNHFGERGSIDVIAWHPSTRCLLIVEVKSRMLDTQATLSTLDRKVRIVPTLLARERGWHAATKGVVLVMPGLTANRSAIGRHAATFAAAFPDRAPTVRRWIRQPAGPLAGVWFIAPTTARGATQGGATRRRVRRARARSAVASQVA